MHSPQLTPPVRRATAILAGGVVFVVVATLAFVILAGVVWRGATERIDEAVLAWFTSVRTPALTDFFGSITALGSFIVNTVFTVGIVGALVAARHPGAAIALAAATLGGGLLSTATKLLVGRARPAAESWIYAPHGNSFPSGHTIGVFTFWVTMALLVINHVEGRALRAWCIAYALSVAVLVAISRMYLGVHYLSDVVGGALLGSAWAAAVVLAEHAWRHREPRAQPPPP